MRWRSDFNSFGFLDPVGNGADFDLSDVAGVGCQPLGDTNAQDSFQGTYQTADNMTKVVGHAHFQVGRRIPRCVFEQFHELRFARAVRI